MKKQWAFGGTGSCVKPVTIILGFSVSLTQHQSKFLVVLAEIIRHSDEGKKKKKKNTNLPQEK